jgi:subtilisin family serine protease
MAAPHVSGVAALIKAKHPDWTPLQIRDALINSAEDLGSAGKDELEDSRRSSDPRGKNRRKINEIIIS